MTPPLPYSEEELAGIAQYPKVGIVTGDFDERFNTLRWLATLDAAVARAEQAEADAAQLRVALNRAGKKISGAALHQMHEHAEMEVREGLRMMSDALNAAGAGAKAAAVLRAADAETEAETALGREAMCSHPGDKAYCQKQEAMFDTRNRRRAAVRDWRTPPEITPPTP